MHTFCQWVMVAVLLLTWFLAFAEDYKKGKAGKNVFGDILLSLAVCAVFGFVFWKSGALPF